MMLLIATCTANENEGADKSTCTARDRHLHMVPGPMRTCILKEKALNRSTLHKKLVASRGGRCLGDESFIDLVGLLMLAVRQ